MERGGKKWAYIVTPIICFVIGFSGIKLLGQPLGLFGQKNDQQAETAETPALETTETVQTPLVETDVVPIRPKNLTELMDHIFVDSGGTDGSDNGFSKKIENSSWDVCVIGLGEGGSTESFLYRGKYYQDQEQDKKNLSIAADLIDLWIMGAVLEKQDELKETDYSSLDAMIRENDSAAADDLIVRFLGKGSGEAGIKAVNDYIQGVGCSDTVLQHLPSVSVKTPKENLTTAKDCCNYLSQIYEGRVQGAERMRELLKPKDGENGISAVDPGNVLFHRRGQLLSTQKKKDDPKADISHDAENDAAVIRIDGKTYALSILCTAPNTNAEGLKDLQELTRQLVHLFKNNSGR